jgi:mono/diheme cytochrome c family protein
MPRFAQPFLWIWLPLLVPNLCPTSLEQACGMLLQVEEPADVDAATPVSFRREIAAILLDNCLACHGTRKAEGGYRVDNYQELLKPGDSGMEPIVGSEVDNSELLRRLTCDVSERMPADDDPLPKQQIALMRRWVEEGAHFDGSDAEREQPLGLVMPPLEYPAAPEKYPAPLPITAVAMVPGGEQLITSGYHELLVWSIADGRMVRRIPNVGERTYALAFTADGKRLVVACGEPGRRGEVRIFDFEQGCVVQIVSRAADVVLDLALQPNGQKLATAAADGLIRIIDLESGEEIQTLASHADWVTAVAWSPDGTHLVSASRDKSAKVYDTSRWELVASYLGHGAAVRDIVVAPGQQHALSVGADNKLHRWSLSDASKVSEVGLTAEGFALRVHEQSAMVAAADQRLRKIELSSNAVAHVFEGPTSWALSLDASGELLVGGSLAGEVFVWNLSDGQPLGNWLAKP